MIPVHIDRCSLANDFLVGHLLEQNTFFEEIEKVGAATWLSIVDGKISKRRYWSPPEEDKRLHIDDAAMELSQTLRKAVAKRIGPDNRTSVEITGGADSRMNLACAVVSGSPFHAVTV